MAKYNNKVHCNHCGKLVKIVAEGVSRCPNCSKPITAEGKKTNKRVDMPPVQLLNVVNE